jgi:hypothetical protein
LVLTLPVKEQLMKIGVAPGIGLANIESDSVYAKLDYGQGINLQLESLVPKFTHNANPVKVVPKEEVVQPEWHNLSVCSTLLALLLTH